MSFPVSPPFAPPPAWDPGPRHARPLVEQRSAHEAVQEPSPRGISAHGLPAVDAHTILAARAGNPQASTNILRCYHDEVFGFIWQMTHLQLGNNLAQDLCQETFARFFIELRNEPNPLMHPIKTWLFEIARMVAEQHRHAQPHQRAPQKAQTPVAPSQSTEAWKLMCKAMQKISPAHREILHLRQDRGLSYIEIARTLGVCVGTVKSRLSRSRKALEREMLRLSLSPSPC